MKRFLMVLLSLAILIPINIKASDETIQSMSTGYTNVEFDNGYYGYCLDRDLKGALPNDKFTSDETNEATSNQTQEDISQYLKLMFVLYFEDLFVPNGNGGYELDFDLKDGVIPGVVYHFTEGQHPWGQQATIVNGVKAYAGEPIKDDGHQITLTNGDVITFHFMVMVPENSGQQYFFAYKIDVSQGSTHKHEYGGWQSDDEQHWKECECEEKTQLGNHEGGEATCISKKECTTCGKEYGVLDTANHKETEVRDAKPATDTEDGYTGDTYCKDCDTLLEKGQIIEKSHEHIPGSNWENDDAQHWKECECGEKLNLDEHDQVLVDKKDATCDDNGYTGDLVCSVCEKVLEEGTVIPAHTHDDEWKNDEENHWKECECGKQLDSSKHEGGEANCISKKKCTTCGKEYGTLDSKNHKGQTELRGYVSPTTEKEGYTGDTYCKDCNALVEIGTVVPKLHEHNHEWNSDDSKHWKECECEDTIELENHKGGEATCTSKKKCSVCGKEYGELDSKNHEGEIEVRGYVAPTKDKEGYTGDTYCKDCNALIKKGTVLSKLCDTPNTGDNSNILLWILLMIISSTCCLLVFIKKYRNI